MATTYYDFTGGVDAVPGWGQKNKFMFYGTWSIASQDTWTIQFTSTFGDFTHGAGNLKDAEYNGMLSYGDRVYIANGGFWSFSALEDPAGWEEQDIGAGRQSFRSNYGAMDSAVGLATIQGRVAVFGRYNIQTWNVAADPDNFSRSQVLQNIGTVAPDSIQSLGELDVLFLDDTGIRSLRTRESNLDAYVSDIGEPIDSVIVAVLEGLTDAQKATAVSIVEPTSKRYWLFLNGVIYVLSRFTSSKIYAWSTYLPTYESETDLSAVNYNAASPPTATISGLTIGRKYEFTFGAYEVSVTDGTTVWTASGEIIPTATSLTVTGTEGAASQPVSCTLAEQVAFTPERFVVYQGKVYARSTDGYLFVYGGTDGTTYDGSVATVELPWLDVNKNPSEFKQGLGLDAVIKGPWRIYCGSNPRAASLIEVTSRGSGASPSSLTDSTYDVGHFPYSGVGTHLKFKAVSKSISSEAKLARITYLYNEAHKK